MVATLKRAAHNPSNWVSFLGGSLLRTLPQGSLFFVWLGILSSVALCCCSSSLLSRATRFAARYFGWTRPDLRRAIGDHSRWCTQRHSQARSRHPCGRPDDDCCGCE